MYSINSDRFSTVSTRVIVSPVLLPLQDTFFDAEDGSSRNLKMSLLKIDRVPIPPHEWLQFDNKNQEFYGVPLRSDIGRKEYQLVAIDKDGENMSHD